MGKSYSKTEDKEVIITQNASGGSNTASDSEQENHIKFNNILMTTFLVLIIIVILALIYKKMIKGYKKWIDQQVDTAFIRRMRQRLSGRRDQTQAEDV